METSPFGCCSIRIPAIAFANGSKLPPGVPAAIVKPDAVSSDMTSVAGTSSF